MHKRNHNDIIIANNLRGGIIHKSKNINVIITIIVYAVFLLGIICAILIGLDLYNDIAFSIFYIVYYAMIILIPTSIIISLVYFIKIKNKKNFISLGYSILSLSWVLVVLFVAADVISNL